MGTAACEKASSSADGPKDASGAGPEKEDAESSDEGGDDDDVAGTDGPVIRQSLSDLTCSLQYDEEDNRGEQTGPTTGESDPAKKKKKKRKLATSSGRPPGGRKKEKEEKEAPQDRRVQRRSIGQA